MYILNLIMLFSFIGFATEKIQFKPNTTQINIKQPLTVEHKGLSVTVLKGWSVGMNEFNNKSINFEILLTPNKDLTQSDVFASIQLKGKKTKQSIDEKSKELETKKDYEMSYKTINKNKWIFLTHEITHQKGFKYIEVFGTTISGEKEYNVFAGYPKSQEETYKQNINAIISSINIDL